MCAIDAVRLHIPEGVAEDEAWEALWKAMGGKLPRRERDVAGIEAEALQGHFRQEFRHIIDGYVDHCRMLELVNLQPEGQARDEALAIHKRQRNRTEWQVRSCFNRYYRDMFVQGKRLAGSDRKLAKNEREMVRRLANNEAQFALNMLVDIETGEYTMPIEQRVELYGNALEEMKWLGFLYADLSPDRYVRWVMNSGPDGEECIDCAYMAGKLGAFTRKIRARAKARKGGETTAHEDTILRAADRGRATQGGRWGTGVYRVQELVRMAVTPQSGKLACCTNCRCKLQDARKPQKPPKPGRQEQGEFVSLAPKVKTMDNRALRPNERARYSRLADKWAHEHVGRADEPIPV